MAQSGDTDEWMSLVRGSDVVGYVRIVGCDMFHIIGRFRAGPAYDQYEQLLAKTCQNDASDWRDALEAVDTLELQLIGKGEPSRIRDFTLEATEHVRAPDGVPIEFKFIYADDFGETDDAETQTPGS